MGCVEGQVKEEGPVFVLLDEMKGLAAKQVGRVTFLGDPLVIAEQGGDAVALVRPVIDAGIGEAVVRVETALERKEPACPAAVPLADHARGVSCRPERLSDGHLAYVESQGHLRREG